MKIGNMLKSLVIIQLLIFMVACGNNVKEMQKEIQVGIQEMFDKDYSIYGLKVSKVEITGDSTYKGIVEFLYNGKPITQPVIINKNGKEYSYEFKFNPYVIKEEAEKTTKKIIEDSLSKQEYKKYKMSVSSVKLFSNGENSYDGLALLKLNNKEYNLKVDVKYSEDGAIMYKIEEKEFEELNSDLLYAEAELSIQAESKTTIDPKLHTSINTYSESLAEFKTKKFNIRVDRLDDGTLRYASCSANSTFENKPDVVLNNGVSYPDGARGDVYYDFISGEYTYRIYSFVMGNVGNKLEVRKNDKVIVSEDSL